MYFGIEKAYICLHMTFFINPKKKEDKMKHPTTSRLPKTYFLGNIQAYLGVDGEVELSRRGAVSPHEAVSGKGKGELRTLRLMWGIVLTSARNVGLERLYCEPTLTDGRGQVRVRAYQRAGFKVTHKSEGLVWMERRIKK